MTKTPFDPSAEKAYWERVEAEPPSSEELARLDKDIQHWIPDGGRLFAGKRVLDVGAGTAPLGVLIAQRYEPEVVVSLELVIYQLRATCEWQQQLSNLQLVCGDLYTLPFPDATFDLIVANS